MNFNRLTYIVLCILLTGLLWSCSSMNFARHGGTIPPGHAKKIYGHQSAKAFAPGQVKKAYGLRSAKYFAPGHRKR